MTKHLLIWLENAEIPGLPDAAGKGVLLWGSGAYRKSEPYLAYLPLDSVDDPKTLRYYAGLNENGAPRWSNRESDASALFEQGGNEDHRKMSGFAALNPTKLPH
jgi:hypothetical protein